MSKRILSEEVLIVKLNAAQRELEKITEKYEKCTQAVEKYQKALEVFNELGTSETGSQDFSDAEKLEFARKAILKNGGKASYKQIHEFFKINGINQNLSEQATYGFLKRRSTPENGIEFLNEGVFKISKIQSIRTEQLDEFMPDFEIEEPTEEEEVTIGDLPF